MTVLFGACTSLFKFQFVAPQNDTERVRVKTITGHVRHDLAARPAGKFPIYLSAELGRYSYVYYTALFPRVNPDLHGGI